MVPNHTVSQRLPSVEKQVGVIKKNLSGFFLAGIDFVFITLSI
jgi:hypothetical protein